jgi:acetoin utilization deacetylase AcuC-like enzyme
MVTLYYAHPDCRMHEMGPWHSECPERLEAIERQLQADGLMERLALREAPWAERADVERVHAAAYVAGLEAAVPAVGYRSLDSDTVLNPYTMRAAWRAAGAAVAATAAVCAGEGRNAFCAVRPPGHHALPDEAMGFCFFNNVAVAAAHALAVQGLERVAIVDFDVHHGNGTEAAFAGDERVLMVSFFQHPLYPYSGTRNVAANMVNVPLPAYAGMPAVRAAVEEKWLPALQAHRPQMIFVSAGFDAHREDELADLRLVEADYAWLTRAVMAAADRTADGRLVSCLEGGYSLAALGRSVSAHVAALLQP